MKEGSRLYISSGGTKLFTPDNNFIAIMGVERNRIVESATHRGVYDGEKDGYNMRAVERENERFFVKPTFTGLKTNYGSVIEQCETDAEKHGNTGPVIVIVV